MHHKMVLYTSVFFPIAPLHIAETIPWPFEDRRLDVVLVPELWGSRCLLRRDRVGSVHFQSYTTQKSVLFHTKFEKLS